MFPNLSKAIGPSLAVLEGGAVEPHSWERQIDIRETRENRLCTCSVGFETPQCHVCAMIPRRICERILTGLSRTVGLDGYMSKYAY